MSLATGSSAQHAVLEAGDGRILPRRAQSSSAISPAIPWTRTHSSRDRTSGTGREPARNGVRSQRSEIHLSSNTPLDRDRELERSILDLAVDDWYGLWEILHTAARALNSSRDDAFRDELRDRLADMMTRELIEAQIWSEAKPRAWSADEMRTLGADSLLWAPPSESPEELRIGATEAGNQAYFGQGR